MPFEHMTNKWDYDEEFVRYGWWWCRCCMRYFASSLKCRATFLEKELFFPASLFHGGDGGTCQGRLSFAVIPQESSRRIFHHKRDVTFSTSWQLGDKGIRQTLKQPGKKCRCEETKENGEKVCACNEMNKSPIGEYMDVFRAPRLFRWYWLWCFFVPVDISSTITFAQ